MSVKFDQFAQGNGIQEGDIIVGLRNGTNTQFNFPGVGILDAVGNYIFQYSSSGNLAVNFPIIMNSLTGLPVIFGADGLDGDVAIWIKPGGSAGVKIDDLNFPTSDGVPGAGIVTDGAGNLSFTIAALMLTATGTANQVLVNGTFGIPQGGNAVFSTPQDIAPISSPTFANLTLTNPLTLANGGTSNSLTASNGGIIYSDATKMQVLAGTSVAQQMLQSGNMSAPSWSTSTWPVTTTLNQILYSPFTNVVSGLATANSAILYTNSSGAPAFSASMTNGQVMIGATGSSPLPATLTAGAGMTITNGPNSVTFATSGGGTAWVEVTGTSQVMSPDTSYIANNAGLVTLTLPAIAPVGSVITVVGKGAGGWLIAQNAGQNQQVGSISSTVGTGGSVASVNRYNSINYVCIVANTTWTTVGAPQSTGLTIV